MTPILSRDTFIISSNVFVLYVIYECSQSTTPPPNGCKFENTYRYDGEVFTAQDGCNKCWCNKGEIICPFENDCENSVARRRSLNKNS